MLFANHHHMLFYSAAETTRFLRGKTASAAEVAETARRLLRGEIDVFLPNRCLFVLELVCDRMNDFTSKPFKGWKFEPALWTLWAHVWTEMALSDLDLEARARAFAGVKILQIASAVLQHAADAAKESGGRLENGDLVHALFGCLELFQASGYIPVDEFCAVGLVASYGQFLFRASLVDSETQVTRAASVAFIERLTSIVGALFELPRHNSNYKPSKKSIARYFAEALPTQLELLAGDKLGELGLTLEAVRSIFTSTLFQHDVASLPAHLEILNDPKVHQPSDQAIKYLFEQTIASLAASNIATCEAVYVKLTAGNYSHLAEKLIAILAKVNRNLSQGFVQQLYDAEMVRDDVNWNLASYLARLDPLLASKSWKAIVEGSKTAPLSDILTIAGNLAAGFVGSRDFAVFVKDVYAFAVTISTLWSSNAVISKLAPLVNELSGNQLAALILEMLQTKQLPALTLLVHGLLLCPAKQKACESLFSNYSYCHAGWSEIAFYVLCIYGDSLVASQPDILSRLSIKSTFKSPYDFFVALRVVELTLDFSKTSETAIVKHLNSVSDSELLDIALRWFVVLANYPAAYLVWIERMFSGQMGLDFLEENVVFLCEIPAFLASLAEFFASRDVPQMAKVLSLFPPIILRKHFQLSVESICQAAMNDATDVDSRNFLVHALQGSLVRTPFDKDFKLLCKMAQNSDATTLPKTLEIATQVWSFHIMAIKSSLSASYVAAAYTELQRNLSSELNLALCRVVLSHKLAHQVPGYDELLDSHVSAICSKIAVSDFERQLEALSGLSFTTETSKTAVKNTAKALGKSALKPESKAQLFHLVAATETGSDFVAALFCALYVELPEILHPQLLDSLTQHISINPKSHSTLLFNCIRSLEVGEFVSPLFEILTILCGSLNKSDTEDLSPMFVAYLLALLTHYKALTAPSAIRAYKMVVSLLANKAWLFEQYSIELLLTLVDMEARNVVAGAHAEDRYVGAVNVLSFVVLHHRYRLFSRYHLLVRAVSDLMVPLSLNGTLGESKKAASAYARLVSTLCEPQQPSDYGKQNVLTSQAAMFKDALRKHAHILLVNYIHFCVALKFSPAVSDELAQSASNLMALFSMNELQLVNQCLDNSGRAYFRTLYSSYKTHGKWRE